MPNFCFCYAPPKQYFKEFKIIWQVHVFFAEENHGLKIQRSSVIQRFHILRRYLRGLEIPQGYSFFSELLFQLLFAGILRMQIFQWKKIKTAGIGLTI